MPASLSRNVNRRMTLRTRTVGIGPAARRRHRVRRTVWTVLLLIVAALILLALAGCSGARSAVDVAPTAMPTKDPAAQVVDADTCATWTARRFKGGRDPIQVAGAQANWVAVLIYEATGRELGDANPGDPDRVVASRVADRLSMYCPGHPGESLVAVTAHLLSLAW